MLTQTAIHKYHHYRAEHLKTRKVLVYKPDVLPYSETFIKEQMLAYRNWHGVLVGHRRTPSGLPLDGLDVRLLLKDPPGQIEDILWRLRRLFGRVSRNEVRRLAAENAQLFHAHFGTVAVDIWPLVRALGLPMAVTLHGFDINIHREWWEAGHGGWRRRSYPLKLIALAREPRVHFIAVSETIRERAIEYGISPDKVTVCHIGVDTERFRPGGLPITKRAQRVLFVGRLVEKKGATYLIEAFAKVAQEIPGAELIIVGDGPLRAQLEEQARRVSAHIEFLGAVSSAEVKRQMDLARVFCLPSIRAESGDAEGLPISIIEASSMGLPTVISFSEKMIVKNFGSEGRSIFLFHEKNVDELFKSLQYLLESDDHLPSIAQRFFLLTRRYFDILITTNKLEALYDNFAFTKTK